MKDILEGLKISVLIFSPASVVAIVFWLVRSVDTRFKSIETSIQDILTRLKDVEIKQAGFDVNIGILHELQREIKTLEGRIWELMQRLPPKKS